MANDALFLVPKLRTRCTLNSWQRMNEKRDSVWTLGMCPTELWHRKGIFKIHASRPGRDLRGICSLLT